MNYQGKIKAVKEVKDGTQILLELPGEFKGQEIERYSQQNLIDCEVYFDDRRRISTDQVKKIWATIGDISKHYGYLGGDTELLKEQLTMKFCIENNIDYFSLSRRKDYAASLTVAKEFISFLIDFCIENEIPLEEHFIHRTEDIDRAILKCLETRTCVITGRKGAEIHHCTGSRIGMGRNRNTIEHRNLYIIPLIREWHDKVHQEGEREIFKKYHIYGIKADEELLRTLNLNIGDID